MLKYQPVRDGLRILFDGACHFLTDYKHDHTPGHAGYPIPNAFGAAPDELAEGILKEVSFGCVMLALGKPITIVKGR